MLKTLFKYFVELTGNPASSAILKAFSRSAASRPFIKPFANYYGINQDEMEYALEHYKSLHSFFTRRISPDCRPVDYTGNTLISPVDGVINDMGKISQDNRLLVKNQFYSAADILGDSKKAAAYKNGYYFILYLSPKHYHHFHYPIDGQIIARYALGGTSYPVNNLGLRLGKSPFSTNHRIITEMATQFGKVSMVKVGALNINSIHLFHASPNCKKGEELGYFSFGSTVILFIENSDDFMPVIKNNQEITMGQPIGKWHN